MCKSPDLLYTTQNLLGCSERFVLILNPSQTTASASVNWSTLHFFLTNRGRTHSSTRRWPRLS